METLWLHGMGGSPNKEKIAYMKERGLNTHALHLDYNREPKRFEILRDYCIKHQIQLLVGSSFGGFLAFWLSEELGIPCLLLNPAVSLRNKRKTKPSGVSRLASPICLTALGAEDDKVDPERTALFMEKDTRDGKVILTRTWQGEGHGFTMQAFEEILDWALPKLNAH